MSALQGIIDRVSARGEPRGFEANIDTGEVNLTPVSLTPADAELLQGLLVFFDEFSRQNGNDVRAQTAEAHRRIGEIRQRLGQLEESEEAFLQAIAIYTELGAAKPDEEGNANRDENIVITTSQVWNELAGLQFTAGRIPESVASYQRSIDLLTEGVAEVSGGVASRFALAQTYVAMINQFLPTAIVSRDLNETEGRSPGPPPGPPGPPPPAGRLRRAPSGGASGTGGSKEIDNVRAGQSQRDIDSPEPPRRRGRRGGRHRDLDQKATSILKELLAEDPENADYQFALARVYRAATGGWRRRALPSDQQESLQRAIDLLKDLTRRYPQVDMYRLELADTLLLTLPRDGEAVELNFELRQRTDEALAIAQGLVREMPDAPEYRATLAGAYRKKGALHFASDQFPEAESSYREAQRLVIELRDQFPSLPIYQVAAAKICQQLGNLWRQQERFDESRQGLARGIAELRAFAATQEYGHFYDFLLVEMLGGLVTTIEEMGEDPSQVSSELEVVSERLRNRRGRKLPRGAADEPGPAYRSESEQVDRRLAPKRGA